MSGWGVVTDLLLIAFCVCFLPLAKWEERHWEKSLARDEAHLAKLLSEDHPDYRQEWML